MFSVYNRRTSRTRQSQVTVNWSCFCWDCFCCVYDSGTKIIFGQGTTLTVESSKRHLVSVFITTFNFLRDQLKKRLYQDFNKSSPVHRFIATHFDLQDYHI